MAGSSLLITFVNETSLTLRLNPTYTSLYGGVYTVPPPEIVYPGQAVQFGAEGPEFGLDREIEAQTWYIAEPELGSVTLNWRNNGGGNQFSASAPQPLSVGPNGDNGENNAVWTFTLSGA